MSADLVPPRKLPRRRRRQDFGRVGGGVPCPKRLSVLRFDLNGLQGHPEPSKDVFSHEGQPAQARARHAQAVAGDGHLRAPAQGVGVPAAVDPPRRPALCQWPHSHGHPAQQGAQGLRGQVAQHAGAQLTVRARVGLPRTAHRAPGGRGARPRHGERGRAPGHGSHREAAALSRVRRQVHRHPARGVQAPGYLRRLERSVPDHGPGLSGDHRPGVRTVRRARSRAQGPQARALVHALQDGARPGRGRVRGADHAVRLRQVPARLPVA